MSGGGDFKIYNGDKELDKEIKKKTFAIEIDDTLYINCIGLKFKSVQSEPGLHQVLFVKESLFHSNSHRFKCCYGIRSRWSSSTIS